MYLCQYLTYVLKKLKIPTFENNNFCTGAAWSRERILVHSHRWTPSTWGGCQNCRQKDGATATITSKEWWCKCMSPVGKNMYNFCFFFWHTYTIIVLSVINYLPDTLWVITWHGIMTFRWTWTFFMNSICNSNFSSKICTRHTPLSFYFSCHDIIVPSSIIGYKIFGCRKNSHFFRKIFCEQSSLYTV